MTKHKTPVTPEIVETPAALPGVAEGIAAAPAPAKRGPGRPKGKAPVSSVVLSFNAGVLAASNGAVFNGTNWTLGDKTAEVIAAEIAAADKALTDAEAAYEAAQVARAALSDPLAGLVNPNEYDPKLALRKFGPASDNFFALVSYWQATRTQAAPDPENTIQALA